MTTLHKILSLPTVALALCACATTPVPEATISIDLAQRGADIPTSMYGIFFEEINHAGDGGLYAELIQNRSFEDATIPEGYRVEGDKLYPPALCNHLSGAKPHPDLSFRWNTQEIAAWTFKQLQGEGAAMALTTEYPLNEASPTALAVTLPTQGQVAISNSGFWGMNILKDAGYFLRLNTSNGNRFEGKATIKLVGEDGTELCNRPLAIDPDKPWCEYGTELIATGSDHHATLVIELAGKGTLLLDYVSLFPAATFHNRENGLRKDVAETLEAMRPAFVRWPGGCIVEGITLSNRIQWKKTIGDPMTRPGIYDTWGYRATMGFGYHEFLQFCEDIHADGMFVCNIGLGCQGRVGDACREEELDGF
ncbi:MAG: alpha-L-arabinofuranosidase, partial [Alistipes sp.]